MLVSSKKKRMIWTIFLIGATSFLITYYMLASKRSRYDMECLLASEILIVIGYMLLLVHIEWEKKWFITIVKVAVFFGMPFWQIFSIWDFSPSQGKGLLFIQNGLLVLFFQLVIAVIFLNEKIVLFILVWLNTVLCFGFDLVMMFRKAPLVPSDIAAFKTAMAVSGNYTFHLSFQMILHFCTALLMTAVCVKLPVTKSACSEKGKYIIRGVYCILAVIIGLNIYTWNRGDYQTDNFDVENMNQKNGTLLTFYLNLKEINVQKPENYSLEAIKKELGSFENQLGDFQEKKNLPNVIVIMDEAFSDLGVLGDLKTNEDPLEFCHSLEKRQDIISGYLNVSVWGGSTCNTEFEVLTGNTLEMLPYGSIPYMQYVSSNTDSLCNYFHHLGYRNVAIHPYWGQCWRRNTVYRQLGFDEFIDAQQFDKEGGSQAEEITIHDGVDFGKNLDYIRNYISDDESFSQVKKQFEKKKDGEKLFLFNVTMQNHGGYVYAGDNFEENIYHLGRYDSRVNQYLSLLDKTDDALRNLIDYFEKKSEPVIILFFGDHQPGLSNTFYEEMFGAKYKNFTMKDFQKRYTVPYYIWANYPLQEEGFGYKQTSANYLSMILKKAAGLPFDSWDTFREKASEQFPILTARILVDKNDTIQVRGTQHADILNQYNRFMYYKLFQFNK